MKKNTILSEAVKNKRSIGITIMGWLLITYFIYSLVIAAIYGIVLLINTGMVETSEGPLGSMALFAKPSLWEWITLVLYAFSSLILLLLPFCALVGGIGVLKLKKWARKFVVIAFGLGAILQIINMLSYIFQRQARLVHIGVWVLFFILFVSVIYFFTRPKVKEQFKSKN